MRHDDVGAAAVRQRRVRGLAAVGPLLEADVRRAHQVRRGLRAQPGLRGDDHLPLGRHDRRRRPPFRVDDRAAAGAAAVFYPGQT